MPEPKLWLDEKLVTDAINEIKVIEKSNHECFGFTTIKDWPRFKPEFYCPQCEKLWSLKEYFNYTMGHGVTASNYLGHYASWCLKNGFAPLRWDVLEEIFFGCETNEDYRLTIGALYDIQLMGFNLSAMKDSKTIEALNMRLSIRLELFKRVPSATNMLLVYNLIEEITLKLYKDGSIDITDKANKLIEKFDKCKSLALDTKIIPERVVAFERSLEMFHKLVNSNGNENKA